MEVADRLLGRLELTRLSFGLAVMGVVEREGDERVVGELLGLVTVAAFLPSPELYQSLYGVEELAEGKERAAQARGAYEASGNLEVVAA